MLAKLGSLPADYCVVDLEDGVAPVEKEAARGHLRDAAADERLPGSGWALRVNALDSAFVDADLDLVTELAPPAVVLPKAEDPSAVAALAPRWAERGGATLLMIETANGVGRVRELAAAHASVIALLYGSGDLRLSLGARPDEARSWERHAMGEILLAARMAGCAAIDAVTFAFRDDTALEREARIAREIGFDGKSCIHPAQVETIHRVFASSPAEIDWAGRVLAAWRDGDGDRAGVVAMDGEMIEALHVDIARKILRRIPDTNP